MNARKICPINRGATGNVSLAIFDPLGRRVAELIPGQYPPLNSPPASMGGTQRVVWDASGMPAGTYIVELDAGGKSQVTNVHLVR